MPRLSTLSATFLYLLLQLQPSIQITPFARPWLNQSLATEQRLQLLLSHLSTTQKFAMVQGDTELEDNGTGVNACIGHISGNTTLGIPSICMGDGPAGVGNSLNNVTTFPAPVVGASSWNTSLQYAYGQALAQEHKTKGRNVILSPTINILRSPLWARSAETFSEDPHLTSRLAVAQTLGIQSQGALACPKHFAAYNQDTNRFGLDPKWQAVNINVDERALQELYLPAFKAAVKEAHAASVMCSYNRLNGFYACENEWLLNQTLRREWGFQGFVVADWYFSTRSTVPAVMAGLDISMPGGSLEAEYGFPAYYEELLVDAVRDGRVPAERLDDMVARLWRYMFELGAVDEPVTGNAGVVARTQAHLDLAQEMAEQGSVLLKHEGGVLPLGMGKYGRIAVFGVDGTERSQVSENHGGFVIDETMVVQAPLDAIKRRGARENISVSYSEAYPGSGQFGTIPGSMFVDGRLKATYWTTANFSGPINQTAFVSNITSATYPAELWTAWPQVFSCRYEGIFQPNTSGIHHFSLVGQGDAVLYLNDQLIANMSKANFANTVQGFASLTTGEQVRLRLDYSMGYSLSTAAYGVTLGVDVGNSKRHEDALTLAEKSDVSIIFASDRFSEGADNNLGLSLPGEQDALIADIASRSQKTMVILNTNSAVLMPWLNQVDAVMQSWYGGQQIGLALERLLFGDISPSGKLPLTFPQKLEDTIQITSDLEVEYEEGLYVGYKRFDGLGIEPLFPFGHGLTYTSFELGESRAWVEEGNCTSSGRVVCSVKLSNTGAMAASEVVQLYVSYPDDADEPPKLLKGFSRVALDAGESAFVDIQVKLDDLRTWSHQLQDWTLVHGHYGFLAGFSAGDIRGSVQIVL
ncbi:glycoside hydrolase family 3 domain-containing protein [Teratosphaeria nubilosa]|uniref:beta-glucosidase n=1 Tax=Teratosphaeria nubilosa TaxID=161662 RepID=A0A6G1KYJ6_9PEZI|nr:glycoside hydrolase family 3 domain-containing protein [Teratosphaeria nubilosa]